MTNGSIGIKTNNIETGTSVKYASGTNIVLTATGDSGYEFEKWYDNGTENTSVTTASRTIEVGAGTAAVTYTATFARAIGYFKTENGKAYYYASVNATTGTEITASNMGEYLGREVVYTPGNALTNTSYGTSTTYRLFYVDVATTEHSNGNYYGDGVGTIYLKADCDTNNVSMSSYGSHNSSDSREIMKKLNPKMGTTTYNETHDYCVAWMTDPGQWSAWKDSTVKVEGTQTSGINYVVGGPSLEMYIDSYNAYLAAHTGLTKNGTDNVAEALVCEYVTSGYESKGYIIGFLGATSWANSGLYQDGNSLFSYNATNGQQMFNPGNSANNSSDHCFWLASPSPYNYGCLMMVYGGESNLDYGGYNGNGRAFCPLVSIKSGVCIQEK